MAGGWPNRMIAASRNAVKFIVPFFALIKNGNSLRWFAQPGVAIDQGPRHRSGCPKPRFRFHSTAQVMQRRFGVASLAQDHEIISVGDEASAETSLQPELLPPEHELSADHYVDCFGIDPEHGGQAALGFDYCEGSFSSGLIR